MKCVSACLSCSYFSQSFHLILRHFTAFYNLLVWEVTTSLWLQVLCMGHLWWNSLWICQLVITALWLQHCVVVKSGAAAGTLGVKNRCSLREVGKFWMKSSGLYAILYSRHPFESEMITDTRWLLKSIFEVLWMVRFVFYSAVRKFHPRVSYLGTDWMRDLGVSQLRILPKWERMSPPPPGGWEFIPMFYTHWKAVFNAHGSCDCKESEHSAFSRLTFEVGWCSVCAHHKVEIIYFLPFT